VAPQNGPNDPILYQCCPALHVWRADQLSGAEWSDSIASLIYDERWLRSRRELYGWNGVDDRLLHGQLVNHVGDVV